MENSSHRISLLLETLKSDLKAMRSQDVKLMKQLIGISESIRTLTKSRTCRRRPSGVCSYSAQVVPASVFNAISTPLIRQQSAPTYNKLHRHDSTGSIESSEDFGSSYEDISEETADEVTDYLNCSTRSLPGSFPKSRSLSVMTPLPDDEEDIDDRKYEGILMTNIKLWKHSRKQNSLKTTDFTNSINKTNFKEPNA